MHNALVFYLKLPTTWFGFVFTGGGAIAWAVGYAFGHDFFGRVMTNGQLYAEATEAETVMVLGVVAVFIGLVLLLMSLCSEERTQA